MTCPIQQFLNTTFVSTTHFTVTNDACFVLRVYMYFTGNKLQILPWNASPTLSGYVVSSCLNIVTGLL